MRQPTKKGHHTLVSVRPGWPVTGDRERFEESGSISTVVLVGLPRGQHKVLIELVDAEGNLITAQTVIFDTPGKEVRP